MRTGMHDKQQDGGKNSVDYEQHDHYMLQHSNKDVSIHNLDSLQRWIVAMYDTIFVKRTEVVQHPELMVCTIYNCISLLDRYYMAVTT